MKDEVVLVCTEKQTYYIGIYHPATGLGSIGGLGGWATTSHISPPSRRNKPIKSIKKR